MAQLRQRLPEMRAHGAQIVVVGSGRPEQAKNFLEVTGVEAKVFCDRDLESYRRAGLKRGLLRTLNPLAGVRALRAMAKGFRQTKTQGDPFQQGGVAVITP